MNKKIRLTGNKEVEVKAIDETKETDFKRLIKFLTLADVGYSIWESFESGEHLRSVKLKQGYTKVEGYPYFYTVFNFDGEGKLLEVGAYE